VSRAVLISLLLVLGCQGPLSGGIRAFEESRFVEAASELRAAHPDSLDRDELARWALYLGLSELALGNLHNALPRLCSARAVLERHPDALSLSERGALESAWRALGKMPAEALSLGTACGRTPGSR
jgi:hypothetical protein